MIRLDFKKRLKSANGWIDLAVCKEIDKREFITLFGKSGSGKTTLLRILAGLEKPDEGVVVVDNQIWFDSKKKIDLAPQKRGVGFVFQDYALFNHMSVKKNLLFAQKQRDEQKIDKILKLMEIDSLAQSMPQNLSGGQKQRVAVARALMSEPKLLLLDEPLSALDLQMRQKLQNELLEVHKHFDITSFLVSHDIDEVSKLSNRVFHIDLGKIIADDTPSKIFKDRFKMAKILSIDGNSVTILLDANTKLNIGSYIKVEL